MAIKHGVCDTDTHFIIDPITRVAKNDGLKKVCIVRDDHNSEVCTFELPRYVEGHDMALCNRVEVHYLNTDSTTKAKSTGVYVATDFGISETDPESVTLTWLISSTATKYPGQLAFALHFACVDDLTDDVRYWWSSATNTSISVLDSINNTEENDTGEVSDLQDKTATPSTDLQVIRPDGEYRGLSKVVIEPIPDDYVMPSGSLFIGANGEYEIREYESITVNVSDAPALQEKEFTANGTYRPDEGFVGFSKVDVNTKTPEGTYEIDMNGEYYIAEYEKVLVQIEGGGDGEGGSGEGEGANLQTKTITANGNYSPDGDYDGFSSVTVEVPQVVYTGTETVGDSIPVYGLAKEQFVAQGIVVFPAAGKGANGVDVPQDTDTSYATESDAPSLDFHASVEFPTWAYDMDVGIISQLYYKTEASGSNWTRYAEMEVFPSGAETKIGTYTNYNGYTGLGFAFVWEEVYPPGSVYGEQEFEFGYALCACIRRWKGADGQIRLYRGRMVYCLPFESEAECNAAMNLVYKPSKLVKINEKVIDYTESDV